MNVWIAHGVLPKFKTYKMSSCCHLANDRYEIEQMTYSGLGDGWMIDGTL